MSSRPSDYSIPNFPGTHECANTVPDQSTLQSNAPYPPFVPNTSTQMYDPTPSYQNSSAPQQNFAYDASVHVSNEPNYTTPISQSASVQSYGTKFNAPPQKKSEYPYQITCASYDGRNVNLIDIDSKRILLIFDGELQLSVTDNTGTILLQKSKEKFETPYGEKNGYIFWKGTKKYIDCLDSLFQDVWRKELKVPLPEIVERNPGFLSGGTYNNVPFEIYEYSEKSIAVFTDFKLPIGMYNGRLKHPDKGSTAGYIFGKQANKIKEVEALLDSSIGDKFLLSAPLVSRASVAAISQPILLKTSSLILSDVQYTVEQWRYSEASYALTFTPEINIENDFIKYNPNLNFSGAKRGGYIFSKSHKQSTDYMKKIYPEAIFDDAVIIPSNLSDVIPTAKTEQSISELSVSLMNKISKCDKFTQEDTHGKYVYYGKIEDVESEIMFDILMKVIVGDKCLIITKKE